MPFYDCLEKKGASNPVESGKGNHQLNPNYITGFVDGFYKKEIKLFSTNQQSCTNNHLSLVVWGTNLSSLVGKRRITKQESNMIKLPPYNKSIIIGLLLSDG